MTSGTAASSMSQVSMMVGSIEQLVSCDLLKSAEALCCVYLTGKGAHHRSIDPGQHILLLEKSKHGCLELASHFISLRS